MTRRERKAYLHQWEQDILREVRMQRVMGMARLLAVATLVLVVGLILWSCS